MIVRAACGRCKGGPNYLQVGDVFYYALNTNCDNFSTIFRKWIFQRSSLNLTKFLCIFTFVIILFTRFCLDLLRMTPYFRGLWCKGVWRILCKKMTQIFWLCTVLLLNFNSFPINPTNLHKISAVQLPYYTSLGRF